MAINNADLNILEEGIKLVENKVFHDYAELEHLQGSSKTVMFVNMTLKFMREKLYDFFRKKRANYSLIIKDYKTEMVENSEATIYVNCISGIKNFSHTVPYFATVLSVIKNGITTAAIVNNYVERQMFNCAKGGSCFVNTTKVRVSGRNSLNNSLIAVKYGNDRDNIEKITSKLSFFNINNCSVLDFCNTACGKYDGCIIIDGIKEELEIGELFIRESGGLIHYLNSEKTSCIFSNSLIFDDLKRFFNMEESGWLNINKPKGWTSTKVVAIIKKITRAKKVGHGGTLDPLASGVLPICINRATKQVENMMNHEKQYLFHITFGELRTTYDEEGEVIEKNDFVPLENDILNCLKNFIGVIKQTPPVFSAIKINGKRACDLVREGKSVELNARNILIKNIDFNGFINENTAEFVADCGRGCYVRSLGVDLAKSVGALGYVSKIERRRVGDFLLDNSVDMEENLDLEVIKKILIVFE